MYLAAVTRLTSFFSPWPGRRQTLQESVNPDILQICSVVLSLGVFSVCTWHLLGSAPSPESDRPIFCYAMLWLVAIEIPKNTFRILADDERQNVSNDDPRVGSNLIYPFSHHILWICAGRKYNQGYVSRSETNNFVLNSLLYSLTASSSTTCACREDDCKATTNTTNPNECKHLRPEGRFETDNAKVAGFIDGVPHGLIQYLNENRSDQQEYKCALVVSFV